jgi:hypothetical protein
VLELLCARSLRRALFISCCSCRWQMSEPRLCELVKILIRIKTINCGSGHLFVLVAIGCEVAKLKNIWMGQMAPMHTAGGPYARKGLCGAT